MPDYYIGLISGTSIDGIDAVLVEFYTYENPFPWLLDMDYRALRTDRYKYIYYHGLWDDDGFYDLQTDPIERHNLINLPAYREQVEQLKKQL